jgi:hypothetical protein
MNDLQMTILAADRRRELVAQADRTRLVREARRRSQPRAAAAATPRRGGLRIDLRALSLDLAALFGRPSA